VEIKPKVQDAKLEAPEDDISARKQKKKPKREKVKKVAPAEEAVSPSVIKEEEPVLREAECASSYHPNICCPVLLSTRLNHPHSSSGQNSILLELS